MRVPARARNPEAALARLLGVLARQSGAVRMVPSAGAMPSEVEGGVVCPVSPGVLALAEQAGLVAAEAGRHRILPAGIAWLKRRLSGGDGFLDQHRELGLREIGECGERRRLLVNIRESPLAWLRQRVDKSGRPILSDAQFEAGERLRSDFHQAGLSPRVTASWDGLAATARSRRGMPSAAAGLRDSVAAAQQRVHRALEAVGPELAGVLLDVCCHLKGLEVSEAERGWPQRSGKVVLLLALSGLARHYGLLVAERASSHAGRMTHWGDASYRPTLEAWDGRDD